jgi:hypothetical protein
MDTMRHIGQRIRRPIAAEGMFGMVTALVVR